MRTRLVVLVMLPLIGMLVIDLGALQERTEEAEAAAAVARDVEDVQQLVALRAAIGQERFFTEWLGLLQALGLGVRSTGERMGIDLEGRHRAATEEADRIVASLSGRAAVLTPGELAEARRQVSEPRAAGSLMTAPLEPIERRIDDTQRAVIAGLQPGLDIAGGNTVALGLHDSRTASDLAASAVERIRSTALVFLNAPDAEHQARQVVGATAVGDRALHELRRSADPATVGAVDALEARPEIREFRATNDQMAAGNWPRLDGGIPEWRRMAIYSVQGMELIAGSYAVVQRSADAVSALAADLAREARDQREQWLAYTTVIGGLSLLGSIALAGSITRPLHRLRRHAAALGRGDLDVEPLPPGGPRDVAVTAGAFNDLLVNLRVLEAKARALADLDFEAEALALPLPGPLGQSLQRSLRTLSGSISERDEMRSHILHQASHDDLTGLPNRSAAVEELSQAGARSRRVGRGVGVLLVDIDGFKRINDVHGHRVGDAVLRDVARRAAAAATGASLLARVGGDELLVLVEDVVEPEPVVQAARDLAAVLRRPTRVEGVSVALSVCVGVAFWWDADDDESELLVGADLAVARAKDRGPGSVEIHDRALQEQFVAQAAVEDALVPALAGDDQLFLVYQPVVDLASGRMVGTEALVRWDRPGLGVQPPDSFIPVAERSDLIVQLDRWVLSRAARQLREWAQDAALGRGDVDVAVNVSGRHLTNQSLFDHVRDLLDTSGVDPRRVILEITETALVDDLVVAAAQLEAIRRLGVRIALDDFGTGYTSIAHLRRLPVDIIKIDRSLVQRLNRDTDRALVRMVVELGHQLGTTITAEGVETAEQYEQLRALGCDRAQGYLLSRPVPADELAGWAAARAGGPTDRGVGALGTR